MKISSKTIQILQIELAKKFSDRTEKLDFLSAFLGYTVHSSKELTEVQALEIIHFLKTGKRPQDGIWSYFDKNDAQHRNILSQAINYGWVITKDGRAIADLNALGRWLKSFRSPVQKPLMQMQTHELTKVINALNGMIKRRFN